MEQWIVPLAFQKTGVEATEPRQVWAVSEKHSVPQLKEGESHTSKRCWNVVFRS